MSRTTFLKNLQLDFDWPTYIETNFDYRKAGNGEYRINCINCFNNKRKLYVNSDKCFFNCFACDFKTGTKYDLFDFVAKTEGVSRSQAMMRLIQEYKPVTPDNVKDIVMERLAEEESNPTVRFFIKTIDGLPPVAEKLKLPAEGRAWKYLLSRGLTQNEVLDYQISYIPDETYEIYRDNEQYVGDIGQRVLFPIYGGNHELVSWQARTTDPNYKRGDKYLFCPDTEAAKTLWPYVPPYGQEGILQEGILDTIATRRIGKPVSSYAAFSKHISTEQIELLKAWKVNEVTVFFDIRDAKPDMIKAVETLKMHFATVNVLDFFGWPRERDAGDCLNLYNGTDLLRKLVASKINVYSKEYEKWKLFA